ncbi:outer membrane beta-barrel protein [bacterium]|nr:outer membrane beta-barrel protein [bacterium]
MRFRWITFVLVIGLLLTSIEAKKRKSNSSRGKLSVNGSVSIYDPPGDVSSAFLFEIAARYSLSDQIVGELSVGWSQYEQSGENVTFIPVQLNGEFHPLGQGIFDPYAGAGISANLTQTGDNVDATAGVQALSGISFKPQSGFGVSVEVKYMLLDITDTNSGTFSLGGGVDFNWETEL